MDRRQIAADISSTYIDPDQWEAGCKQLQDDINGLCCKVEGEYENALEDGFDILRKAKEYVPPELSEQIDKYINSPFK